jgi:methionyl aminopeptidase
LNIFIKSESDIKKIQQAGEILAKVFKAIEKEIQPGTTGRDLEAIAKQQIKKQGAQPAFLDYKGYPCVTCVSINHQLVHSIPSRQKFKPGDIVSVDIGVRLNGWCADKAKTYPIGKISPERQKLIKTTHQALKAGIRAAQAYNRLGDISSAIQEVIERAGFSVIRDLAGHGIGKEIHEPPSVFNYGKPDTGPVLKPGMVLALEPMVSAGSHKIKIAKDKWGVETADKRDSAHFEDTIAITKKGPKVLTTV